MMQNHARRLRDCLTNLPMKNTLCKTTQNVLCRSVVRCSIQLSYGRPREERLMCEYNTIASTSSKRSKYRTSKGRTPNLKFESRVLPFDIRCWTLSVGRLPCV